MLEQAKSYYSHEVLSQPFSTAWILISSLFHISIILMSLAPLFPVFHFTFCQTQLIGSTNIGINFPATLYDGLPCVRLLYEHSDATECHMYKERRYGLPLLMEVTGSFQKHKSFLHLTLRQANVHVVSILLILKFQFQIDHPCMYC